MVNYPNKKKPTISITSSKPKHYTSHRGMSLEEDIGLSNEYYLINDIAVIYKKPTPVQIVKVDYPKRSAAKIVEAYYQKPSTTDYNGIYKGKYIDFEAKETKSDTFPFANIFKHQIDHLKKVIDQGGIAFVIIAFTHRNEVYLIDASHMIDAYYHSNRKSITYETIKEKGHLIRQGFNPRLSYLEIIDEFYL
ncbi:MAG: Holliday junction resolvase RecU [Bacilli bacterium]|nr:Holliday junction resolvase RecU [Bacilli bacterium]